MSNSARKTMNSALSRSKSAFFHHNTPGRSTSSRTRDLPPLPGVQNTPTSAQTTPYTCPMPCALHDHSNDKQQAGAGTPTPASNSGSVRSVTSAFFDRRPKKSEIHIDDENDYCVLSEEGVEILARAAEDGEAEDDHLGLDCHEKSRSSIKTSRTLRRTPSLSNLLTPSRTKLRKMSSKMKLLPDTPSSLPPHHSEHVSFAEDTIPPVPRALTVQHPLANTPTSSKSARSSKNFLRRAVFRDKVDKIPQQAQSKPRHDVFEHPLPGTVASRVKEMEESYRRSLRFEDTHATSSPIEPVETLRSASVPLTSRMETEAPHICTQEVKTPRTKWFDRLHIRKSSVKKKAVTENRVSEETIIWAEPIEQDITLDYLDIHGAVQETQSLEQAEEPVEQLKPTLRVQIEPPPEHEELLRTSWLSPSSAYTPTSEVSQTFDRLSLAVSPQYVNQNHTYTFGTRGSTTSYFGDQTTLSSFSFSHQVLVASSPLSGDLHISHSPGRSGSQVVDRLNASFRGRETLAPAEDGDITGRFSIFSYEEKEKVANERPKSDPIPLKHINNANNELKNLLDAFEDTFAYDISSIRTSVIGDSRTFKHSYFGSPAPPSRVVSPKKVDRDIPDDLQDLIEGVVQLNEVLRVADDLERASMRPISGVSSFEGQASTAQDAIKFQADRAQVAQLVPQIIQPDEAIEWDTQPHFDMITARPSAESDRRPHSFAYTTDSARSSMDGFDSHPVQGELEAPRPSFDSGRSSFDEPAEEQPYDSRPQARKYLSSCSDVSNRSSLRDYLAMERPGLGDRMLQDVDEDVALDSIADQRLRDNALRASFASSTSNSTSASHRNSYNSTHFQTARTTNLPFRFSSASDSSGPGSVAHSPTPANGLRRVLNRDSLDCELGDFSHRSLEVSSVGHASPGRRPSLDESEPSSPVSQVGQLANYERPGLPSLSLASRSAALMAATAGALVKQSTKSSLFSLSSVNSSPCPRPPRRKLLMLTGNRLPRPPPAAPDFSAQSLAQNDAQPDQPSKIRPSMSPQQGRVRRLKDSWEAKMSPQKDAANVSGSTSSPRYVRPLPSKLNVSGEIPRPRPLSSISLSEFMASPDTPPPSSPSASELSFASSTRSSLDRSRGSRLANFGRRRKSGHQRQLSSLSKHSIIAEAIPEEVTATIKLSSSDETPEVQQIEIEEEEEHSEYTFACEVLDSYLQDSPPGLIASPPQKSVSPLIIRKSRSQASIASQRSLHLGLDAFQAKQSKIVKPAKSTPQLELRHLAEQPIIVVGEDVEPVWEDLEARSQSKWNRFCHEAIMELQKSKTQWPDTEISRDLFESPLNRAPSSAASPLIEAFSTPGSGYEPDLTSPLHGGAIVGFLMDSQARFRSEIERLDLSQDMPSTPELCHDDDDEEVYLGQGMSEVTPPSPVAIRQRKSFRRSTAIQSTADQASKRTSYQPKSLMLVQKHLSNSSVKLLGTKDMRPVVEEAPSVALVHNMPSEISKVPLARLDNNQVQAGLPKSTKGYKPKSKDSATVVVPKAVEAVKKKAEPIVKPLTPGKHIRAIAKNRTVQVYADEVLAENAIVSSNAAAIDSQRVGRQTINSFLPGRKLSQRRNNAFTAARRKLEGVGDADEQSDRSSGASSSTEEKELYKTGLGRFESAAATSMKRTVETTGVLEAGGSVELERSGSMFASKARPRPPNRRTASGLIRNMR